jgi:hypothetical protein
LCYNNRGFRSCNSHIIGGILLIKMVDFCGMNLKVTFLSAALLSIGSLGFGQADNTVALVDTSVDPAGFIKTTKLPEPSVEGNIYIDEEWNTGYITFLGGNKLEGLQLRFDLQHNSLEFIYQSDVAKVCPLYLLESYQIVNKQNKAVVYANIDNTSLKKLRLKGVAEVLYTGNTKLYAYTSIKIQDPTYQVEFNMGRKTNRIIKKRSFYVDNGFKAFKLSSSLKKNKEFFGEAYPQIEAYAKEYKLKVKNENDLIQLVEYYDKLKDQNSL